MVQNKSMMKIKCSNFWKGRRNLKENRGERLWPHKGEGRKDLKRKNDQP